MTYTEAVAYIESLSSFGIQPGLTRIESLLARLGHPEAAYKTVHVTGTNGKGSVTAYIHAAMTASGLRVGRFTSPHLVDYTERITVGADDISPDDFAVAIANVREAVSAMMADGEESPTAFEVLTAAAFWHFKTVGVDYAIIEVGLGGTLDSTNVITPVVSVITNVSIDHTAYCGETVDEIARHKSGIIKPGVPVVTAALGSPLKILREIAHKNDSRIYAFDKDFAVATRRVMPEGQMVTVEWRENYKPAILITRMNGLHQAVNIACAAMVMMLLIGQDARITEDAMRIGFANTQWPGRFEIITCQKRTLIFDGAHNAGGAEAFAAAYYEKFKETPKTVLFALLEDKDISGVIGQCIRPGDTVVTVPAPTPRTLDPKALASMMPCQAYATDSIAAGVKKALEVTPEGGILVVCGSLYILGEAKHLLTQ